MKAVFSLILSLIIFTASFQNSLFIIDYKMNKAYYEIHCMNKDKPEMDCHGKCQMKMESEKSSNPISQVKFTFEFNILPAKPLDVEFKKVEFISFKSEINGNRVESEFGLNSLQIFYPNLPAKKDRFLKSLAANYFGQKNIWEYGFGAGFGDRAPSVSEGYGFYLFNSMENYDYIGNPTLKNESSVEGNAFIGIKTKKISAKITSSYFYISNYIVGEILTSAAPMTIGARGVKVYTALENATIFNASLDTEIKLFPALKWTSQLIYSSGKDFGKENLPFISPVSYRSVLKFDRNKFSAAVSVEGNSNHTNFASKYGEIYKDAYVISNFNLGYLFNFNEMRVLTKVGVENIFDTYYSTFSDWNNIPRPGRNFVFNLNVSF